MMQKQRSPYTTGGFNLQQLKTTNFTAEKPEGLNTMPFLLQLAQQLPRNMSNSQHMAMASSSTPQTQPMQSLGGKVAGHERGLRSGTPRSYMSNSGNSYQDANYAANYKDSYVGDMPTLQLGESTGGLSFGQQDGDYLHAPSQQPGQQQQQQQQQQHFSQFGPLVKLSTPSTEHRGSRQHSDTGSDSDFEEHKAMYPQPQPTRWRAVYEHLKTALPEHQQQRLNNVMDGSKQSTVLQIFCILISFVLVQLLRLGSAVGSVSMRLWNCKFQLKSILRQILWRMTNLKGHDALVFLSILLITPWLFLVCLIGFGISFIFLVKDWLNEGLCMLRLYVLN